MQSWLQFICITEDITEDFPEDITEDFTEDITEDFTEDLTEDYFHLLLVMDLSPIIGPVTLKDLMLAGWFLPHPLQVPLNDF